MLLACSCDGCFPMRGDVITLFRLVFRSLNKYLRNSLSLVTKSSMNPLCRLGGNELLACGIISLGFYMQKVKSMQRLGTEAIRTNASPQN